MFFNVLRAHMAGHMTRGFTACDRETAKMASSAPQEKLYKILVIGDLGTGKTSIIKRYVHQCFSPHYRATIGVDFALKVLNWDAKTIIRLQLWDIAGQERFGSMTRVYYKEAAGAFIVFDVTRSSTFEAVKIWKKDLDNKCFGPDGSPVPAVLLGNKCDLPSETNQQTMDDFCQDNSFLGYFPTSAKEDIGIGDAARGLVAEILKREESAGGGTEDDKEDHVRLQDPVIKKNGGGCCRRS